MIAAGSALIFAGWILIMPGKWKPQAGRFTVALTVLGSCLLVAGMVVVVQARH